jgi:hypothetical protein
MKSVVSLWPMILLVAASSLLFSSERRRSPLEGRGAPVSHKNHLAGSTSPYLLQHADNPVDWWPWCEEALELARREDKPILVSIGYSACHWCHVMEEESFQDPEIAALMNDLFVCIKVDREERPDLDEIYMTAVQMMTGRGGWPLNVFLTPDLKPFFGGTYFPADPKYGRASWPQVLKAVAEAYRTRRGDVETMAARVSEQLRLQASRGGARRDQILHRGVIDQAVQAMRETFDETYGGFGGAPKFPRTTDLSLILRRFSQTKEVELLRLLTTTLDGMARGGIYDQLGGGFHRYATDERWLVPHFEKMLYDNALLARLYAEVYQVTPHEEYAAVATETVTFVRRELTSPEGGFYSSLDADSEGEEGRFYLWTPDEVEAVLGAEDGALFCRMFDVDEVGRLGGRSILHQAKTVTEMARLAGMDARELAGRVREWRQRLLEAREERVRPARDDKVLADWNGLMISACARVGRILGEEEFVGMARRAADFLLRRMVRDGELYHAYRNGRLSTPGMLDDYAFLVAGLLDLWETTFDARWLHEARRLQERQDELFWDGETAGYFRARSAPDLIARIKTAHDGATPSGNAVAAMNLLRLARLTGQKEYEERARELLKHFLPLAERNPQSYAQMLLALDFATSPSREIVLVGDPQAPPFQALARVVWSHYLPDAILAGFPPGGGDVLGNEALVAGRDLVDGQPAAYVCRDYACDAPVTTPEALGRLLLAAH